MNIIFTILKNFFMNQSSSWSKSFFKLKKGNSSDSSFFMKLYIKYNLSLFRIYFYCTIFFRKHKINTDDYIILVVSITWLPTKSCFSPAFAPTVQFWKPCRIGLAREKVFKLSTEYIMKIFYFNNLFQNEFLNVINMYVLLNILYVVFVFRSSQNKLCVLKIVENAWTI